MPNLTTQAIVLRHADYREHDRMLTLLSPSMGRVEALCRGCKRPQSPLLAASEWFALGEYVLFAGKGHMTVTSCNLTESFFPLRTDYDRLKHATYLLSVAEAAAQPGERAVELFTVVAPFALTLHVPAAFILGKPLYGWPAWTAFLTPLAGAAAFWILYAVFQKAMKFYRSTGS